MNLEQVIEVASEYKLAYQQLQHVENATQEAVARFERDRLLALKRYEAARKAFLELALGEDDEFLGELEV